MRPIVIRLLILLILLATPCLALAKLQVTVSIPPQAYLAARVGGDLVEVRSLLKESQNPHAFKPAPQDLASLKNVLVYFTLGFEFEKALTLELEKTNWKFTPVDCTASIPLRPLAGKGGAKAKDKKGPKDLHIWLNPLHAKIMATHMARAYKVRDRKNSKIYDQNLRDLVRELLMLHHSIRKRMEPHQGKTILVSHPAWGYFAEVYGLKQLSLQNKGKEPDAKTLAAIIKQAKSLGIKTLYVQHQSPSSSALLAGNRLGAKLVFLNPLAQDYLRNLNSVAHKISQGFK